ncbi:MAG: hypothetical protein K6F20_05230 [Bacteroidaceae bacterium]|nr:hypothetical protein [Bacteroidaceae bacterium]
MNCGNRKATYTLHDIIYTYKVTHKEYLFNFSATANKNIDAAGTAEASVANTQIQAAVGVTSASTTATFTATANSSYEFAGWGTTSNATSYESTANPYTPTISNSTAGSTANKTLYAIFKPVFNYSVTANKINGSYGSVNATVTNRVVGNPSETSKSTIATFTATPNSNCTFVGWYYDAAHTNLASTSATYQPTINNTTVGSTANLTLYAWFKSNQTLTWTQANYDPNVVAGVTYPGLAAATASSGLAVTYTSSNTSVATVNSSGDVTGVASSVDAITITARQAGNDEYNAMEATRQFTVINKFQPTFDATGFQSSSGDNYTSYVDDTPTITVANTTAGFTYNSSDPTVVSISKSDNVITLTALKVGTSTVTLNDPGNTTHYSASKTYNITVTRIPNGLAASMASLTANPDGTIAVTFTGQNNMGTAIVGTITNQELSSSVNKGSDVITYADGVITAKNAGTAKITFTQAETDKYAAWTSSIYDITVTKLSNPISITLAGGSATNIKLKYGATASLSYTYANTAGATPTVNRASGSYTTYSAGTITAGNAQGTDIYEIRQSETYKYEAGLATFTIRVNNTDEMDGYVLYDETEESHTPISTEGTYFNEHTLSGPGEILSFKAHKSNFIWDGVTKLEVQCYVNGSWRTGDNAAMYTESLSTSYGGDITCKIPESTTKIRFFLRVGSTLEHCIKDVKVTRKTYVRESHDTSKDNFGTVYTGSTATSATVTVNYSSTNGGNINISSNNSHFVPSISEIAVESNKKATSPGGTEYICGVDGTQTFTVTYAPDSNSLGEETATITIGDLFYSQTITLTATAAKRENTLAVVDEQTLKVDDVVSDVFSGKNSEATLTATWSRDGVATFDAATNKITAVGEGTAMLTLTQLENDYHYGATKTVKVNVSKYDQTVMWVNELDADARTLEVGDELTTNTATSSSGLTVTYSSSNPTALEVNATTGKLTAKDGGANIVITATQAGNNKYNPASITRTFTIIKRENVTVSTTLTDGTNLFPLGSDNITIRTDALITESALTIADGTIVSASFGNNTFTLTALKEGTTTVRLVRAQTEDFYALDITYTIRVVKPVLVLDPTADPVINYSEYSSVTLNRILKSGYNSIALPFSTDVATLTGRNNADDWVATLTAVTWNSTDGYTLFFTKGTTVEANKPYILHLGDEVVNPTWTNQEVMAAEGATVTPEKGGAKDDGWSMTSNFTVDFPMDGKYGIVNSSEGGLMKGSGSNAKLNAFTAYITPPANGGNVKARTSFLDFGDEGTAIENVRMVDEDEVEGYYATDGRRLAGPQKGIVVVKYRDGRRMKVKF